MAKPASLPRWADVSGDIVEPTSGKKDVGWVADEEPPAQYFNWLLNLTYQWLEYVDGNSFEGNFTFEDDLQVDGDANVDGTLTAGSINLEAINLLEDPGNGTNKIVLQAPSALGADYTLTLPNAVPSKKAIMKVASNGTVTFETEFTIQVKARPDGNHTGTGWDYDPVGNLSTVSVASGDVYYIPLELQNGWRIVGFSFNGVGVNSSNNTQIKLAYYPDPDSALSYPTGGSASITGAGTGVGQSQTATATLNTPHTVASGQIIFLEVTATGAGNSTRGVNWIEVTCDYGA